jgi:hypothetical protein
MTFVRTGVAMGVLVLAAACGSSSSGTPANGSPTQEPGNDASTVVPSLDSGPISQLNPPTSTTPAAIQCGSMMCSAPSSALVPLSPCCLADNGCGANFGAAGAAMFGGAADAGALCLDTAPGTPNSSCPSQTAMGFALAGCCTAGGLCGIDLSMIGLGCNAGAGLAALAPPGTAVPEAGPPQSCSGAGGGSDASAGGGSDASPE